MPLNVNTNPLKCSLSPFRPQVAWSGIVRGSEVREAADRDDREGSRRPRLEGGRQLRHGQVSNGMATWDILKAFAGTCAFVMSQMYDYSIRFRVSTYPHEHPTSCLGSVTNAMFQCIMQSS